MEQISLNQAEIKICEWLAKNRYSSNRTSGVANKKIGPQSNWKTDLNGVGAEFAFCKLINVYPDFSVEPRKGGYDCLTFGGYRIDVKTTVYKSGRLLTKIGTPIEDADYYVLMVGNFPKYTFSGSCSSKDLIDDSNIINLGHGEGYGLGQDQLSIDLRDIVGAVDY